MRRYLIIVVGIFILTLLLVVGLFFYVQVFMTPAALQSTGGGVSGETNVARGTVAVLGSSSVSREIGPGPTIGSPDSAATSAEAASSSAALFSIKAFALSSIKLSDTQNSLLQTIGIDPETFVVTLAMISCAETALGRDRLTQIVAGDAPGVFEMAQLIRCL